MTFRRLEAVVAPIGQTLRWTAHDIAIADGDSFLSPRDLDAVREPVLTGVFDGSFGLTVSRPPVPEQLSLTHQPLFDRTATTFMDVFRTARDTQEPAEVLRVLSSLRHNALNGYRKLGQALSAATQPTRLRWKNDELIAVSSPVAATVVDALGAQTEIEYDIVVVGTLVGGDLPDERFHIEEVDENGRTIHHRGNVEPTVLPKLREFTFGATVRATISVTEVESQYLATPRRTRVLTAIDLIGGTRT